MTKEKKFYDIDTCLSDLSGEAEIVRPKTAAAGAASMSDLLIVPNATILVPEKKNFYKKKIKIKGKEGLNCTQHNDIQHNDIQYNDTHCKVLICDTQHKWYSA